MRAVWRFMQIRLLVLTLLIPMAAPAGVSADEATLSVPVRIVGSVQTAPSMDPMIADVREAPPEVTPAARMPQYQLHHKDHGDPGDIDSASLRFILATPGQPLLIEASILIDGRPFRQARENRVQEILRFIADPESFKAEAARIAADAQAEVQEAAAVENSPSLLQSINELIQGAAADDKTPTSDPSATDLAAPDTPVERAVPAVEKYNAPATVFERIERYIKATGNSPSADEVRWLLSNWVDGPVLLFLNDNFQRFRADQQPVFMVLDRDRDGKVSVDELKQAVASFQECDLNHDDIVEATELSEVADDPRDQPTHASTGKLIFRMPDESTANLTLQRLTARYANQSVTNPGLPRFDVDGNGALSADELRQLHETPADIQLRIELSTAQPESSRLAIVGFGSQFAGLKDAAKMNTASVTLSFASFDLEFLAVQGAGSDQISAGAVEDGYAMLPELDPDGDGRFTIRELRELNDRLSSFDRNADGTLSTDETQPTFRVCIGLGPTAHQPLALLRSVHAPDSAAVTAGPQWFQEMDKNKDDDLSRREFPGTDEQFKQLDSDADDLISAVEANEAEK